MRIVRRPHHVFDADDVPVHDRIAVDHERGAPITPKVEARFVLQLHRQPPAVAPPTVVELLEDIRDPAAAGFDGNPDEIRETVVDARTDDLRHVGDHARGADGGEPGEVVTTD